MTRARHITRLDHRELPSARRASWWPIVGRDAWRGHTCTCAHIYYRVGRYVDAAKVNTLAALVDEQYIAQCHAQGFYPVGYYGPQHPLSLDVI